MIHDLNSTDADHSPFTVSLLNYWVRCLMEYKLHLMGHHHVSCEGLDGDHSCVLSCFIQKHCPYWCFCLKKFNLLQWYLSLLLLTFPFTRLCIWWTGPNFCQNLKKKTNTMIYCTQTTIHTIIFFLLWFNRFNTNISSKTISWKYSTFGSFYVIDL